MAWNAVPSYDEVKKALASGDIQTAYRFKDKYVVAERRNGPYDNAMFIVNPETKTVELTSLVDLIGFGIIEDCVNIDPSEIEL